MSAPAPARVRPAAASPAPAKRPAAAGLVGPVEYVRVTAAVAVICFHAYQHSGYTGMDGWPVGVFWHRLLITVASSGVDAFFVITVFLSARDLVRGALGTGPVASGRSLLSRRAAALLPTYYVAALLVWALSNPRLPGHWADLLLHLTFTQVYSDAFIFWTLGPAWFIAVTVHFYVLLAVIGGPLQRWCLRMRSRAARVAAVLAVAATAVAVCWGYKLVMAFELDRPVDSWSTWFGPLARLDLFGLGLVLALVSVLRPAISSWVATASSTVAFVLFVGTGVFYPEGNPDWWPHSTFGLAAFFFLLPSVTTRRRRTADGVVRFLPAPGRPPGPGLLTVAMLTYGLFIWQEPVLRVLDSRGLLPPDSSPWAFPVTAVLMVVVTLGVAWLSYHLLEVPGKAWAAWSDRVERHARPVEAGTAGQPVIR
ncbi:MAG TPA: acyltransferase [Geodermatophilus sp.]|nr:acyltransferase [Geodermatophilus sp.]